jgi:hypothetical protein
MASNDKENERVKMLLRIVPALIAVVLVGSGTLRAKAQAPPPAAPSSEAQNPDLEALWRYSGSWRIQTESFDSPYSKAGKRASTLHNDCWRTEGYVACRQIVNGDSKILLVFTCSRPDHYCTSYQVPTDGSAASSGTVHIDGETWTFPWQTADKDGKATYFRVVNVWGSPTSVDFRQEYSTDNVHWTKTATGHEFKTSSK